MTEDDVSQVIQAFAHAALNPAEWHGALTKLNDTMSATSCALEFVDLTSGAASMECPFPLDAEVVRLYEERIFHINPRVRRAQAAPVGRVVDDRYLFDENDPNAGEFLDWLSKTPNRYMQGAKILDQGGHQAYFGAHFSESHGPPLHWHGKVSSLVVPHLVNLIAIGRDLSAGKLNNDLLVLDHLDSSRVFAILDRAGQLVECSAGFEKILQSRQLLSVRGRSLVAVHSQHRKLVDEFLTSALGEQRLLAPPMPVRLSTPDSPRGLVLRAVPILPNNDIFDVFRPAALITINDLDQPFRVRRGELVALFGLTPREADVAALVSEGHTPENVAFGLKISEYTVRQHLKVVFDKMGVSRQAELVAIVSRLC